MGTTAMVANSTIRLSPGWNAVYFWGVWAICIAGLGIIVWAALKSKRWARWTTQDILIDKPASSDNDDRVEVAFWSCQSPRLVDCADPAS